MFQQYGLRRHFFFFFRCSVHREPVIVEPFIKKQFLHDSSAATEGDRYQGSCCRDALLGHTLLASKANAFSTAIRDSMPFCRVMHKSPGRKSNKRLLCRLCKTTCSRQG